MTKTNIVVGYREYFMNKPMEEGDPRTLLIKEWDKEGKTSRVIECAVICKLENDNYLVEGNIECTLSAIPMLRLGVTKKKPTEINIIGKKEKKDVERDMTVIYTGDDGYYYECLKDAKGFPNTTKLQRVTVVEKTEDGDATLSDGRKALLFGRLENFENAEVYNSFGVPTNKGTPRYVGGKDRTFVYGLPDVERDETIYIRDGILDNGMYGYWYIPSFDSDTIYVFSDDEVVHTTESGVLVLSNGANAVVLGSRVNFQFQKVIVKGWRTEFDTDVDKDPEEVLVRRYRKDGRRDDDFTPVRIIGKTKEGLFEMYWNDIDCTVLCELQPELE